MPRMLGFFVAMVVYGFFKNIGSFANLSGQDGMTVLEEHDHVVLRWTGNVSEAMTKALAQSYQDRRSDPRRIVLSLNSNGGRILDGMAVIEQIKLIKKTHTVDTVVDERSTCASMCVPIYLTGTARTAAARARFMFHEPYLPPDQLRGLQEQSRELRRLGKISEQEFKAMFTSFITDRFFTDYLERAGLDGRWVDKLRRDIKGRDLWFTAEQLRTQRSGVVDKLLPASS
jgi:ATP-dependent protease ClpP protease subunit